MVKKSNNYTRTLGRRKCSVTTLKLFKGKGECLVNSEKVAEYFPGAINKLAYERPFVVTDTIGKFYYEAKSTGGGKAGQLLSITLAISRALKSEDESTFAPLLRANNLLTVDSRVRQRRMVGTGGKARRQKQSPKR